MLRHRHRVSKAVDIFLGDRQYLGFLSPRLNSTAESLTDSYVEQGNFLKLYFPEGEIDFVVSEYLTKDPVRPEKVLGRTVRVETSAEIVAKKIWHRAPEFKARDIFDLALVITREPGTVPILETFVAQRRPTLEKQLKAQERALREDFAALDTLDFSPAYDECLILIRKAFDL